MIATRQELTREFITRAKSAGLRVDVPMDGAFKSDIAIVAEAPGEREIAMRLPLVGGSGRLLWETLKKHNITRNHVYMTNVVKRQVSMSVKTDDRDNVNKNELHNWVGLLRWELAQLPNVKYVLLLGNYALEALTGNKGITNWRGTVIESKIGDRDVHFICANNPAMVLREPKLEVVFRFDIGKLNRVMSGNYKPYNINAIINPSYTEVCNWIDKMHDDKLPVSFDIEVVSNETACIGLANSDHEGMCVNFRTINQNRYSRVEELDIRYRLQKLFREDTTQLVAQNGIFDSYWLMFKDRIDVRRVWFDTMLAHHTLYSQLPHSLSFLTTQYTDHPFYKDEGKNWKEGGNIDEFWVYNVKDVCVTRRVYQRLLSELRRDHLENFFFYHVMRLQPHLVRMIVGGVRADIDLKDHITESLRDYVAELRNEFHQRVVTATGDPAYQPSPTSWKQLATLFFSKLKLVGRGTSTNEANRQRMLNHPRTSQEAKEVILSLNKFTKENKFLSTYAEMNVDEDGRIRCEYKQHGTQRAPGRLSSSKLMWGSGMNLQNQPERAYPMFVADEGYGFGYFDLAQAEARVVGWEARIDTWKEQFEKARLDGGYDCHRALAADMWNIPYDDVPTKDRKDNGAPTLRFIAKRCRHGLNYRMGPDRLAETTGLPNRDAEIIYSLYHRATPRLKVWWDELFSEVNSSRALYNAMGRKLVIMERIAPEALESIIAFKPQSLVGDKICSVIYKSHDDDDWPYNARIALNIHDALMCIAPLDKIKSCLRIMKKHAEVPVYIHGDPLVIPADCKISVSTGWTIEDDGSIRYMKDNVHGMHRWYGLESVNIEA